MDNFDSAGTEKFHLVFYISYLWVLHKMHLKMIIITLSFFLYPFFLSFKQRSIISNLSAHKRTEDEREKNVCKYLHSLYKKPWYGNLLFQLYYHQTFLWKWEISQNFNLRQSKISGLFRDKKWLVSIVRWACREYLRLICWWCYLILYFFNHQIIKGKK